MSDERKVVKVACASCPGNDSGYKLSYEDEMQPGEVLFGETPSAPAAPEESQAETEETPSAPAAPWSRKKAK